MLAAGSQVPGWRVLEFGQAFSGEFDWQLFGSFLAISFYRKSPESNDSRLAGLQG